MAENRLRELQHWFAAHCDGAREHHHGISIETTDNPGWWVRIDLQHTELADECFTTIAHNSIPMDFSSGHTG